LCTDCAVKVATPVTARVSPIVANPETVKSSVVVNCSAWTVPENVPLTALEIDPLATDKVPSVKVPSIVNPLAVKV